MWTESWFNPGQNPPNSWIYKSLTSSWNISSLQQQNGSPFWLSYRVHTSSEQQMVFIFQYTIPTHLEEKCWMKLSATPAVLAILRQRAPDGTAHLYYDSWQRQSNCLPPSSTVLGRLRKTNWQKRVLDGDSEGCTLTSQLWYWASALARRYFAFKFFYVWNSLLPVLDFGFLLFSTNQFTLQIYLKSWGMPVHHTPWIIKNWGREGARRQYLEMHTSKPKFSPVWMQYGYSWLETFASDSWVKI